MNKLLILLPLLLGVIAPSIQASEKPEANTVQTPTAEARTITLDVTGMT